MINFLAQVISILSNPMSVSLPMTFLIVYRFSYDFFFSLQWMIITSLFVLLGGIFMIFGVKIGLFSDFDVSIRKERPPVFAFVAIIGVIYSFTIYILSGPPILLLSSGGLLLGVILDSIINRKIKASIHLAVYSSFALTMGILYGGMLWILILLSPIIAWSRIYLRRHVLAETVVGTILGISLVTIVFLVIQYLY